MSRQLTENPDDMVDAEEEMSSEDLTITGDCSGYNFWRKKGILLPKTTTSGSKQKK